MVRTLKKLSITVACLLFLGLTAFAQEMLIYHPIKTDGQGKIIPWYSEDPGIAFDHTINLVWNFWDKMRTDMNGLPYYMNHQVWNPAFNDPRGIGGDQFAMALSSWTMYYAYSGNERVKANMEFIASYYLSHGFSPADCKWPEIPFPYNTLIYSGVYDGDMRSGIGVAQPDKAGSFGLELIHVYKISSGYNVPENKLYLDAAINIANTLVSNIRKGDENHSPWPFKVDVFTGKTALLRYHDFTGTWIDSSCYTTNWAPTMQLFLDLIGMNQGNTAAYRDCFEQVLAWMKTYPLKNNKWGPFFEDVDWWSDTQINAMTFARFIMTHREYFPEWEKDVSGILDWTHRNFNNETWKKYGVVVTNEQTAYTMPGNSHTSRQAADELLYMSLTGDRSMYENDIRKLYWATYMVDFDGRNRYPGDEPWLTDGYGDYVRHFLRAMDADPSLAPSGQDHIISSTTVLPLVDYAGNFKKYYGLSFDYPDTARVMISYRSYETKGTEKIRLRIKPSEVQLDGKVMRESGAGEGYTWEKMDNGGLLMVHRENGNKVLIIK
jgi:hypothetical protein